MSKKRLFVTIFAIATLLTFAAPVLADNIQDGGNYGLKKTAQKLGYYADIQETIPVLILQWLKVFLGFTSIIFLGFTLYAGVRWITARGKDELVTKAKDTLQGSITGFIIIALSFAITNFILTAVKVPTGPAPDSGGTMGCCCTTRETEVWGEKVVHNDCISASGKDTCSGTYSDTPCTY